MRKRRKKSADNRKHRKVETEYRVYRVTLTRISHRRKCIVLIMSGKSCSSFAYALYTGQIQRHKRQASISKI